MQSITGTLKYEEQTGQVFRETTCPAPVSESPWQSRTLGILPSGFRSDRGASSLLDTALRAVTRFSFGLSAGVLQDVPWRIGEMIWKEIVGLRLDSFEIWVAFTSVYSEERIKSIQYRNELIDNPSLPLEKYVVPATSQSFQWITLLTICSRGLAPGQLVNLCSLHNLGALDIMLHPTAINREAVQDNVIRAWSRSASDDGAFLRLRVLSLRGWKSVTGRSLGYLSCFPVLVFFMVEDTCITRRHNEFGPTDWDCQRTAKMDWAYEMLPFPKNCWKIALRRCHMEARCFLAGRCGMPQAPEEPILHLSLGVMDWFSSHDRMTGPPVIFFRRLETRPESIYPREQRPEMTKDGFGQGAANRAERRSLRSAKQRPIGEVLEQFTDIRQAGLGGKTYVAD